MVRTNHQWRTAGLCALISLCAALAAFCAPAQAQAGPGARMDRIERAITREINKIRRQHGLPKVHSNRGLARAANSHSADMLRANFFAHASSNGMSMSERVRRFKRARRIGENLAYVPTGSGGVRVARGVVTMWMNSPAHRNVILTPAWRRIGVARKRGAIGGLQANVFTADFSTTR